MAQEGRRRRRENKGRRRRGRWQWRAGGWKVVDGVGLPGNGPPSVRVRRPSPGLLLSFLPSFRCRELSARLHIACCCCCCCSSPSASARPSSSNSNCRIRSFLMQSTEGKQTRKRVQNQKLRSDRDRVAFAFRNFKVGDVGGGTDDGVPVR